MTLPHVDLGNAYQDTGSGINSFIKGLLDQRQRQAQLAMQDALAKAKVMEAQRGERPFSITSQTPNGLEHGLMDPYSGQTKLATGPGAGAPESQIILPTQGANNGVPGYATTPRYQPGQPAKPVQLPQGQVGRMEAPVIEPVETGNGPGFASIQRRTGAVDMVGGGGGTGSGAGGQLLPRAQQFEVEKAQFAANMSRAAKAMESASPDVIERVVGRQNLASVLQAIPGVGGPAAETVRSLMAVGLSPDEANWLANFNTFLGFAVPELAGKQMTITEMRQQAAMFAPLMSEPEESRQTKRQNVKFRVQSAIQASGSGWNRLMADPSVSGSVPADYGGQQNPTPPPATKKNKYGYER